MEANFAPPPPRISDADFRQIVGLVRATAGIRLGPSKRGLLDRRLGRRMHDLGLRSFADYHACLAGPDGAVELALLLNAVTTNVTAFYREQHHFRHLREVLLPPRRAAKRLRFWSAGCATGEEPYSIAMTVLEARPQASRDIRVLATDIDTDALRIAREALYPRELVGRLPPELRLRHFEHTAERGLWALRRPARDLVRLRHLNLLASWPMRGRFDAIFCRNVMIYFDAATCATLLDRLADRLLPGGYLYLGHAEALLQPHAMLEPVGRTAYRRVP